MASHINRIENTNNSVIVSNPCVQQKRIKIFVQRDYSQGTEVKFQVKFPIELEGLIDRKEYEQTIIGLNVIYAEAEKITATSICEGCFGCLTSYIIYGCIETQYEKHLKHVSDYIDNKNETLFGPLGLNMKDPIERGLRVIEITAIVEIQNTSQF